MEAEAEADIIYSFSQNFSSQDISQVSLKIIQPIYIKRPQCTPDELCASLLECLG